jgi:hypothetical protein
MRIERDDLSRTEVHGLLRGHLANMYELSPPESVHALDLSKLRSPDITFWTVWDDSLLLGCGALKELIPTHGEVKSMNEWAESCREMVAEGFRVVPSVNPYWDRSGRTFEDVDGYRVVLQKGAWAG